MKAYIYKLSRSPKFTLVEEIVTAFNSNMIKYSKELMKQTKPENPSEEEYLYDYYQGNSDLPDVTNDVFNIEATEPYTNGSPRSEESSSKT